jgi:multiple sugar transport system ATP-binding protein
MAAIVLDRVTKRYPNGHIAVDDLSLEIAAGELLVLVGPSGSGKSTVLRLIAGLEVPDRGRILLGGDDVTAVPPQGRDLAMVFQSYALYPHKSVRENLAFGLRMRATPPGEIATKVEKAAAALGISEVLDRRPAQLSGGQRQRVALGRAIVRDARAFLLDEPLSNLDPLRRTETRAEIALLHRRLGATMVYVTHDQEEAMTLGTRIAVMNEGRLEQVGAPLDVYDRPETVFAARFVGTPAMNVWRRERDGRDVFEGLRPGDIRLTAADSGLLTGRIEVVEALGTHTVVRVGTAPDAERTRVLVPADTRVAIGDRVGMAWDADRVHVFDAATGRRI